MLFDIFYGWRQWRAQRVQWLIYVFGLAIITALFTLILQIKLNIDNRDAQWQKSGVHYISFAAQKSDGSIKPIQGYATKEFVSSTKAIAGTNLLFKQVNVSIDNQAKQLNVLFYDKYFTQVFQSPAQMPLNAYEKNLILLADDISNHSNSLLINGQTYPIHESLPKTFSHLSSRPIDALVPLHIYDQINPLLKQATANNVDSIRLGMPVYFGIAITEDVLEPSKYQTLFQQLVDKYRTDSIVQIESTFDSQLFDGIELSPKQKQFVTRQMFIVSVLFVCCLFIFISNYYSLIKFQELRRQAEFQLKRNVGATDKQVLLSLIREQILFLIVSIVAAFIFSWLIHRYFIHSEVFVSYFSDESTFNIKAWLFAFSVVSFLFIILSTTVGFAKQAAVGLPTEKSNSMNKFSLRKQHWITLSQFSFALIALSICSALFFEQITSLRVKTLDLSTFAYKIENPLEEDISLLSQDLSKINKNNIALSANSLFTQSEPALKWANLGEKFKVTNVKVLFVNAPTINLLSSEQGLASTFEHGSVYINQAMAKLISPNTEETSLLGKMLSTEILFSQADVKIAGVIPDHPHSGVAKQQEPFIYFPLSMMAELGAYLTSPFFYCLPEQQSTCEQSINALLKGNFQRVTLSNQGTVSSQLEALNIGGTLIMSVGGLSTGIILMLLLSGFYFQSKNIISNKASMFGLKLAVGANNAQLIRHEVKLIVILLTMATVISSISTYFLIDVISLAPSVAQFTYLTSIALTTLLTLAILVGLLLRTLKLSPNTLLSR